MNILKKQHTELKNIHQGQDIWVVGAGPSLNHVDAKFFENKITMGVNRVCQWIPCDYIVSKDDRGFKEIFSSRKQSKIILSRWESGDPDTKENRADFDCYYFDHSDKIKLGQRPKLDDIGTDQIVVSYSTITSAIHLAAYMGASTIMLCGHDCGVIDNHAAVKGYYAGVVNPVQQTIEGYAKWVSNDIEQHTLDVKSRIKQVYDVDIYSLNPFINLNLENHKYIRYPLNSC